MDSCQRWVLDTMERFGPTTPARLSALAVAVAGFRPADLDYAIARLTVARQITNRRALLDLA